MAGVILQKRDVQNCVGRLSQPFFCSCFGGSQIRAFPSKLMFETLMYANIMLFIYTSVHMSVVCLHSVSDPKMSDFYSVFFRFNEMDIKYEYIQLMYIYIHEKFTAASAFKKIFFNIFIIKFNSRFEKIAVENSAVIHSFFFFNRDFLLVYKFDEYCLWKRCQ